MTVTDSTVIDAAQAAEADEPKATEPDAPAKKPAAKAEPKPKAETPKAEARKLGDGEYVIPTASLVEAVGIANRAVGSSPNVASLRQLKLHFANSRLTVTGTDGELGMTAKVTVEGKSGSTAFVDAKLLSAVSRALEGEETFITVGDGEMLVRSLDFTATLFTGDADAFTVPKPTGTGFDVDHLAFAAAVMRATVATGTDQGRPILTGVLLFAEHGKLSMVATDSHRLAVVRTKIAWKHEAVNVPRAAMAEIVRLVYEDSKVKVTVAKGEIAFEIDDNLIVTRLIEGEYVAWDRLVTEDKSFGFRATVDRDLLIGAVKRVRLLTGDGPIRVAFNKGSLRLTGNAQDVGGGVAKVKATSDGGAVTVAFNPSYLLDALESFEAETLSIWVDTPLKPIVLHGGKRNEHQHLIMPVKVTD